MHFAILRPLCQFRSLIVWHFIFLSSPLPISANFFWYWFRSQSTFTYPFSVLINLCLSPHSLFFYQHKWAFQNKRGLFTRLHLQREAGSYGAIYSWQGSRQLMSFLFNQTRKWLEARRGRQKKKKLRGLR